MGSKQWVVSGLVFLVGWLWVMPTCGLAGPSKIKGRIAIDGSSTVYPITEAVAEEFSKDYPKIKITVGVSGTGGGFKRFVLGETDISDASRPIKAKEAKAAKKRGVTYIELPIAYDGLSIVVSKENTWCKSLTVEQLKKIFLDGSAVHSWKDVDRSWPDVPMKLYIPGTDSGTFDYFKEVVAGKKGSIRSQVIASEDDNVLVKGVAGTKGGLGFFGCAYYFENKDKLNAVAVNGVKPTHENIASGKYAPFSRPLLIYVKGRSAKRRVMKQFVHYYLDHGGELAEEIGYVKLPEIITKRARANFDKGRTGTQFLDENGDTKHGALATIYQ